MNRIRREGLDVALLLDPAFYRRVPWKNGGGVSVDVAWDPAESWRFGRTPIVAPGPFSDYSGSERWQVLVAGRGLVLQTPDGEIDVRQPFRPVSFAGETKITSRLEAGPVEVVNLIGDRSCVQLGLSVLRAGDSQAVNRRRTIVYCAAGPAKGADSTFTDSTGSPGTLPAQPGSSWWRASDSTGSAMKK